jgi:8-oxo-dGTP pyrophosphatase MutT (NUDIX family)
MAREETSAGGVVWRRRGSRVEIVLGVRRDRHTGLRTICLPKGVVDPREAPEETARREVAEETGVAARAGELLGETRYAYLDPRRGERVSKRVRFFLMEWLSGEPTPADGELESASWCGIEEALGRLSHAGERTIVEAARARLAGEAPSLSPRAPDA